MKFKPESMKFRPESMKFRPNFIKDIYKYFFSSWKSLNYRSKEEMPGIRISFLKIWTPYFGRNAQNKQNRVLDSKSRLFDSHPKFLRPNKRFFRFLNLECTWEKCKQTQSFVYFPPINCSTLRLWTTIGVPGEHFLVHTIT